MDTDLTKAILEGMSIVSEDKVNNANGDITVSGEITKIQNAAKGIYTIKYQSSNFTAHSINDADYTIGDIVYVLVPQGDFSKNKVIIGKEEAEAPQPASTKVQTYHNEVSQNFIQTDNIEVQLCSYFDDIQIIKENSTEIDFCSALINDYKNFCFSFDIKTCITDILRRKKGDYGMSLSIPLRNKETKEPITKVLKLNKDNMIGSIYNFNDYIHQEIFLTEAELKDLEYDPDPERHMELKAFVIDFIHEDNTTPDIFIKNISFKAIEELSEEEMSGYFLDVKSNSGFQFLDGVYDDDKILTPYLKIAGSPADVRDYDCYWFKEDSSITEKSDYYYAPVGRGWRILNKRKEIGTDENGNKNYNYVTSSYEYRVSKEDVYSSARYKCVLIDSNNQLERIVTILNKNNEISFSLNTPSKKTTYAKGIGDAVLEARVKFEGITDQIKIKYKFERLNKENEFIDSNFYSIDQWDQQVNDTERLTVIKFPVEKIDEVNTVKCEFSYDKIVEGQIETKVLGTASIVLTTEDALEKYYFSIANDNILYKYDAGGIAPTETGYEGNAESRIGTPKAIVARLFKMEGGDELSTSEYNYLKMTWQIPHNSMIVLPEEFKSREDIVITEDEENNCTLVKGNVRELPYTIESIFDIEKNDNTILITGEYDGQIIRDRAVLTFVKDGMSGTNGLQYSAFITYDNKMYGEKDINGNPYKLRCVYFQEQWHLLDNDTMELRPLENNLPVFGIKVFKNNTEIGLDNISVSWNMIGRGGGELGTTVNTNDSSTFGISVVNNIHQPQLTIIKNWSGIGKHPCNIIQATIEIRPSGDTTTAAAILYAYYPIEVIRIQNNLTVPLLAEIQDGFSEVLYDSNGTNPKYNANKPFKVKLLKNKVDFNILRWESSDSLEEEEPNEEEQETLDPLEGHFSPTPIYDSALMRSECNFISAVLRLDREKTITLQQLIAQKKTELDQKIAEKNKEKAFIDELIKIFVYSDYEERLDNVSGFIRYRSKYYDSLENLLFTAEDLAQLLPDNELFVSLPIRIKATIQKLMTADTIDDIEDAGAELDLIQGEGEDLYRINSRIYSYNDRLTECNRNYRFLIEYNTVASELKDYNDIQVDLDLIPTKMSALAAAQNFELTSEFTTMQDFINAELNSAFGSSSQYIIRTNQYIELLERIEESFAIYRENDYIDKKYANDIANLRKELQELDVDGVEEITEFDDEYTATLVRPIVFHINRNNMTMINNWDGNKVVIDPNKGYVTTPVVAAGKKESDNTFTGMLMGDYAKSDSNRNEVGLFGFQQGKQTLFLDAETGSLTLGYPDGDNGQIKLNPGAGESSTIAGWKINKDSLTKGNIKLDAANNCINVGTDIQLLNNGTLIAKKAEIEGKITANTGKIGSWKIGDGYLKSVSDEENYSIRLDAKNNYIRIGSSLYLKENKILLNLKPNVYGYGENVNDTNARFCGLRIDGNLFFAGHKEKGAFNASNFNNIGGSYIYINYDEDKSRSKVVINADQMSLGQVFYGEYNSSFDINIGTKKSATMPRGIFMGRIFPGNTGEGNPANNRISARDKQGSGSRYVYLDGTYGCMGIGANYGGTDNTVYLQSVLNNFYLYSLDTKNGSYGLYKNNKSSTGKDKVFISKGRSGSLADDVAGDGVLCCGNVYLNNDNSNNHWVSLREYIKLTIKQTIHTFVKDNALDFNYADN